jgi:hypothetical protein
MRFCRIHALLTLLLVSYALPGDAFLHASPAPEPAVRPTVPGDRWMEIDLYWFDPNDLLHSVTAFWDRFTPLYAGIQGDKGIILNIGWTVGPIMEWSGNLDQKISLPHGSGQQPWVEQTAPLAGDTQQRMQEWKDRFAKPTMVQRQGYGPWTYGGVKQLATLLREEAVKRDISGFKVGSLVYAWKDAYGETAAWYKRHPEAFGKYVARGTGAQPLPPEYWNFFDPGTTLHADPVPLGGLPNGIAEGTPAHLAFASQWGSLSRAVGLDALMLRDSFGFPVPYQRDGPQGLVMQSADAIRRSTDNVSALVRETKQANPAALLMMYSNGASAIGDWRSNGLDLERVAREGYLDIFVDQTWAGAWNEVGVRKSDFWNRPTLGWSYQLAYTLLHGAILADTRVRHYPLIETFDAWESWDTLHTVPQRLRWGIWAYSHAAVKTPHGIVMPQGSYISWANQGKRLLSKEDVEFLQSNIGAAVRDAANTKEVFGPTLVYSRLAMEWQAQHAAPATDINEWMDQQAGTVMKWQLPIMSATRLEWLPLVHSDLPVIQTPSHLPTQQMASILRKIGGDKPIAIWGSFAGGIDQQILQSVGLSAFQTTESAPGLHTAQTQLDADLHAKHVPPTFPLFEKLSNMSGEANQKVPPGVIYDTDGSAELVMLRNGERQVVLWDPPEFIDYCCDQPVRQIWGGSAAPFVLAASAMNELLAGSGALHVERVDLEQSATVSAWQTKDGKIHLLAGNLEEGLRDDADQHMHFTLTLPPQWAKQRWHPVWDAGSFHQPGAGQISLDLPLASSLMVESALH